MQPENESKRVLWSSKRRMSCKENRKRKKKKTLCGGIARGGTLVAEVDARFAPADLFETRDFNQIVV